MPISFTGKLIFAFIGVNLTIVMLLYRYTTTEAPITLITQLMLPLITWQIILGISFFPEEFITYFLDEMYGNDEAAGDQPIFHQPTNLDNLHSHGDVPPTPIAEQISYDFFF